METVVSYIVIRAASFVRHLACGPELVDTTDSKNNPCGRFKEDASKRPDVKALGHRPLAVNLPSQLVNTLGTPYNKPY
jgi:hypothetical protein